MREMSRLLHTRLIKAMLADSFWVTSMVLFVQRLGSDGWVWNRWVLHAPWQPTLRTLLSNKCLYAILFLGLTVWIFNIPDCALVDVCYDGCHFGCCLWFQSCNPSITVSRLFLIIKWFMVWVGMLFVLLAVQWFYISCLLLMYDAWPCCLSLLVCSIHPYFLILGGCAGRDNMVIPPSIIKDPRLDVVWGELLSRLLCKQLCTLPPLTQGQI